MTNQKQNRDKIIMNFEEVLNYINDYMIRSGQRTLCQAFCKGQCCGYNCIHAPNYCRNMGCSSYLCIELRSYLTTKELNLYNEASSHIQHILSQHHIPFYHSETFKYGTENKNIQFNKDELKFYSLNINWYERMDFKEGRPHLK